MKMEELAVNNLITQNEPKFYRDAQIYWSQVPPTVDGMLGGFGCISNTDIRGSEMFLKKIFNLKDKPNRRRALDCGAGIGRITKTLLIKHFDQVDLVEQNPKFIEAAKQFLCLERRVGEFYNSGLQNFIPKRNHYDVIWCQWVLSHLTDEDLVCFLNECKNALCKNGVIIVKENVSSEEIIPDEEDSSVTRPSKLFVSLFEKADLHVIRHCNQPNFPKQLYNVKLYALRPKPMLNTNQSIAVVSKEVTNGNATKMPTSDIIEQLTVVNIGGKIETSDDIQEICNFDDKIEICDNVEEISRTDDKTQICDNIEGVCNIDDKEQSNIDENMSTSVEND